MCNEAEFMNPELGDGEDSDLLEELIPNTRFSRSFVSELFTDIYNFLAIADKPEGLHERLDIFSEMIENENVCDYVCYSCAEFLHYFTIRLPIIEDKEVATVILKTLDVGIKMNVEVFNFSTDIVYAVFPVCFSMDTSILKFSFEILSTYFSNKILIEEIAQGFGDGKFVELVQFALYNTLSEPLLRTMLNLLSHVLKHSVELCNIYCNVLFDLPEEIFGKTTHVTCAYLLCLVALLSHGLLMPSAQMESLDEILNRLKDSLEDEYVAEVYSYAAAELKKLS